MTRLGRAGQCDHRRSVAATEPDTAARSRMPSAGRISVDVYTSGFSESENARSEWQHQPEMDERNANLGRREDRRVSRIALSIHVSRCAFAANRRGLIEEI